jgi:pimeloyl-ACP methyl ester carboxylesterase
MKPRLLDLRDRKATVLEAGAGDPLVYLHGFADVHGVAADLQPFHLRLAQAARMVVPAHPGCAGSGELSDHAIDDVVFHYLEVLDALGLERFDLVGHCAGGWIAAELAVRHPQRVARLVLIGACGLFVPGHPIGDVFMHSQPERGVSLATLRALYFAAADAALARRFFPDGRGDLEEEVRRYQMLRFGSFVGFKPPYFYHRALRGRLHRAAMPALVLWGEHDRMVPRAHGEAYAAGLPGANGLRLIAGAGHAVPLEQPQASADAVIAFLREKRDGMNTGAVASAHASSANAQAGSRD